jgi:hypothetical protein
MKAGPLATSIELVTLSIWLGAAVLVAAVVAPAAFAVVPSRTLAGEIVGRILPVIFIAGIVAAIVAAACEMRVSSHAFSIRLTAPLIALAAGCAIAQFVLSPRIARIRDAASGPIEALSATDPQRLMFGKLHLFSVLALGVAILGAVAAIGTQIYRSSHPERSDGYGTGAIPVAPDPSLRSG